MTTPLIAVTTWRRLLPTPLSEATDLYSVGTEYADAVRAAGGIPILLPALQGSEIERVLDQIDGLLLSGGQDLVSPERINAASVTDVERDATEFALLTEARRRALPVFGICRGLQAINVFLGGTLIDDLPATAAHPTAAADDDQTARRHDVVTTADWVAEALPEHGTVNSIHHQAIGNLAQGLDAVAWAEDGVIEAVEGTDSGWFLRAVQWHPEKLPGAAGRLHLTRILAGFISAAESSRAKTART